MASRAIKNYIVTEIHDCSVILDRREIFLHSVSDAETDVNTDVAITFLKNIRLLDSENNKPIVVHQHGRGGYWDDGMLIFDAIKYCVSPIIFIMWGSAYSMSSIIPQAADVRVIMPSCSFMIHEGYIGLSDSMTAKQGRSWFQHEIDTQELMLDIYTSVCVNGQYFSKTKGDKAGKVRRFLKGKMDQREDWILNAKQTVEYGFADAVYGDSGYENLSIIRSKYEG